MDDRVDAIAPLAPVDWARFGALVVWTGFLVAIPLIAASNLINGSAYAPSDEAVSNAHFFLAVSGCGAAAAVALYAYGRGDGSRAAMSMLGLGVVTGAFAWLALWGLGTIQTWQVLAVWAGIELAVAVGMVSIHIVYLEWSAFYWVPGLGARLRDWVEQEERDRAERLAAEMAMAARREAECEQRLAERQAGAAQLCAEFGCVHPEVFFLLDKLSSERSRVADERDRAFGDERDDAGLAVRELAVRHWEEKVVLPAVREAVVAWCVRPTMAADRDIGDRARAAHERRRNLMDAAEARGSDRRLTAERRDAHRRLARAAGSARDDVDELLAREIVLPGMTQ